MAMNKAVRVTLYSTSQCSHCRQLKKLLQQHHVAHAEFDVQKSTRAMKEFQRLGARGVPVLLVGESRVDGFQPKKIEQLLKKHDLIR
jgi:glutaredoxin 3